MYRTLALRLVLVIVATSVKGSEDSEYERAVRTLKAFAKLREVTEQREREARGLLNCKEEKQTCSVTSHCCDELVCYWPDGWSLKNDGVCVTCVTEKNTCQRDGQCCPGMHCEKEDSHDIDGYCTPPACVSETQKCRTDGACCPGDGTEKKPYLHCDKAKPWNVDGECSRYRREGECWTDGQCVNDCVKDKFYNVFGTCT